MGSERLGWSAGLLLLCACGSTPLQNGTAADGGGPITDATIANDDVNQPPVDSSIPDTGNGDDNPLATACTGAPFVNFTASVSELRSDGTMPALAGAQIQFSSCAGYSITTDAKGNAATQITKGIALTPIYTANGDFDTLGAEIPAGSDVEVSPLLISRAAAKSVPTYAADGGVPPTILMTIVATGTAPCNSVDGVAFNVTNHPEAIIDYMSPSWPSNTQVQDAGKPGQSVTGGAIAFISGIRQDAGAGSVAVTAGKLQCKVQIATAAQTGNFQLVDQSITVGLATVTN